MSNTATTTEDMAENLDGYLVPVSKEAHLKWWLAQLQKTTLTPPNSVATSTLIACTVAERRNSPVPSDVADNFCLKVFEKRMLHLKVMTSPWLAVFIASVCKNPAHAVMWAFAMKLHAIQSKESVLTLDTILSQYKEGLYSDDTLMKLWGMQKLVDPKGMNDNLLDQVRMSEHEA